MGLSISNCYDLIVSNADENHWTFWVQASNIVDLGSCCLSADGISQRQATVVGILGPPMTPPITWSIEGASLGCGIDTNGLVTAGTQVGGITVRATDTNGCIAEGDLQLCDPGSNPCNGSCNPGNPAGFTGGSGGGSGFGGGDGGGDGSSGSGTIGSVSGTLSVSGGLGVSMSMGRTTGIVPLTSSGAITIGAAAPSWALYSPSSLAFNYLVNAVTVVTNSSGIAQVSGPDGLGNVVILSTNSYEVDFYAPSNVTGFSGGLYVFINSPFATVTIANPDNGTTNNRVRVTAVKDGTTSIYDYQYVNAAWQLTTGGGLHTETVSVSSTNGIQTMTRQIVNGSTVLFASTKKYQTFTWGQGLIEEDTGTGANALTNSYSYYTNGLIQQINHANGSWEYYVYDDQRRPTNVFSSFLNQGATTNKSLCRLIEYNYSTNVVVGSGDNGYTGFFTPRRTVEYLLGQEISRRYTAVGWGFQADYQCQTAGAAWDADDNLITSNTTFTSGYNFGRPQSTWRNNASPYGTYDIYACVNETNANNAPTGNTTNSVVSGSPNDWYLPDSIVINHGSSNLTVSGPSGQVLSQAGFALLPNGGGADTFSTFLTVYTNFDAFLRPQQTTFLDGSSEYTSYDCCSIQTFTNREGTITTYGSDALKRRVTATVNNITTSNVLDGAGNVLAVVRFGSDNSVITNRSSTYDNAGRRTSSTDALGNKTSYTNFFDANGYMAQKTTAPNGAASTNMYYRDGQLYKIQGSMVFPKTYLYGVESDGGGLTSFYTLEQRGMTNEWVKTYNDMAGRQYKTVYATGSGSNPSSQSFYNSLGQLWKQIDPDGVVSLYDYDDIGALVDTAIDLNGNSAIDFAGTDRITQTTRDYTQNSGVDVRRVQSYVWPKNNDSSVVLLSDVESSTDGHQTWTSSFGLSSYSSISFAGNGVRLLTNTAPDGSFTINSNYNGLVMSAVGFDGNGSQIAGTSYGYDPHGRQTTVTDARTGATTYTFNKADQITSITAPLSQTTSNLYDNMGRLWKTVLPDGTSVTNEFFDTGLVKRTYGSRTYPVAYTYDSQGRMTNMTTWTNFATSAGAAITTWKLDAYRGFMTNKVYADGKGPFHAYTNSGKLLQRTWARGVTTAYSYNTAGDLTTLVYSDGTPNVTNTVDRLGRPITINQGTNVTSLVYGTYGQVLSETFNGLTVTNLYDSLWRRVTNGVLSGSTWLTMATNAYDAASRLAYVSDRTNSAAYSYLTNSPLVSQILFQQSGTTRMTTTKSYDNLNRLLGVSNTPSADSAISFNYAYNSANQRTSVTNADGSRWTYQYDSLGQLIWGKKYWGDGTPVAGQQFEYGFDDIGNRKYAASGGDQWGVNLRYENYTANNLNQYTQRTVPGAVDVLGAANSNSTVTVNNRPSYRKGEYFRNEYPITNAAVSVYQSLTNLAVLNNGTNADITTTNLGNLFLPQTPEVFGYDPDGNLTNDGRWSYTWDAENRLTQMVSTNVIDAAKKKLEFSYDYRTRRTEKKVSNWSGGAWQLSYDNRFIYDDWNLLGELNVTNNSVTSGFMWGLDLSGSTKGAGGTGGLLAINKITSGEHFSAYDGNGNMVGLVVSANGTIAGQYEYEPFGKGLQGNGSMATANPFRFSTKYNDDESDLVYFGWRYFKPSSGSWVTRDPARNHSPESAYIFAFNCPNRYFDLVGRDCAPMQVTDLGRRPAITNNNNTMTEGTATPTSWVMSTVVPRCFPGFCTSQYKVQIRACWASIEYWYDSEETKLHELDHVNNFVNNWNALLAVVTGYVNTCESQGKAICYQSLINKYSEYYLADAWASGKEEDCRESGDPNSRPCQQARSWRDSANAASGEASTMLPKCSSTP